VDGELLRRAVAGVLLVVAAGFVLMAVWPSGPPEPPAFDTPEGVDSGSDEDADVEDGPARRDPSEASGTAGSTAPAPPVVTVEHGDGWYGHAGALLAAGDTSAPGDRAELTAWCGGDPCPAAQTTWALSDGRSKAGNPVEVGTDTAGVARAAATVDTRGQSAPVELLAAGRASDWPVDGWVTGDSDFDSETAAVAATEALGWVDACPASPDRPVRRLCATPPADGPDEPLETTGPDDETVTTEPGDCRDGLRPALRGGQWVVTVGLDVGCVSVGALADAAEAAAGRTVEFDCSGDGCGRSTHATVADVYAAASDMRSGGSGDGCEALDIGRCTDQMRQMLAVGAPDGPARRGPRQAATRGDVAQLLLWSSGRDWAYGPPVAARPVSGGAGQTLVVQARVDVPEAWGDTGTLRWPDVDGLDRACAASATATSGTHECGYVPSEAGVWDVDVSLEGPGGIVATSTATVAADPEAATIAVEETVPAPDGSARDVVVVSDQRVSWSLDAGDGPDDRVIGDTWEILLADAEPGRARVRIVGSPDQDVSVRACGTVGCTELPLDRDELDGGDDVQRTVVVAAGPTEIALDVDGWRLVEADPLLTVLHFSSDGELAAPAEGQTLDGDRLRVHPEAWWTPELAPSRFLLGRDGATWEVCVTHPGAPDACGAR
jgi:hypothetical protein